MKILILLVASTLVAANPSGNSRDQCREPGDYRKCEVRCKYRGFGGYFCDELTGCHCFHVPDKTLKIHQGIHQEILEKINQGIHPEIHQVIFEKNYQEILEKIHQVIPDFFDEGIKAENHFKCLTNPDREFCENYCKRKGFVAFKCDLETACGCYGEPAPYFSGDEVIEDNLINAENEVTQPHDLGAENIKPIDENIQPIVLNPEDFQPLDKSHEVNPENKPKIQCNPQFDGDLRCYNYCKTLGMRNGKCQADGQCSCYNTNFLGDFSPNFDQNPDRENPKEKPERKCYPGLENDFTCYRYCKMFGSNYGKCEENGQCGCYDDEYLP